MDTVRTSTTPVNPRTTVLVLGFSTAIAQALLLREAMAAMGGSELAWGTVMALWLIGVGAGSRLGVRFGGASLAGVLPVVVVFLAGLSVVLFRAAPLLTGAAPGETITTWHAAWLWIVAVLPPALAGGLAFPVLAADLGLAGAGRAYGLEAVGALVGGFAISFLLVPLGAAAAVCLTTGAVAALCVWHRSRLLALICLAGCALASTVAGDALARAGWRWAGHPGELGQWEETRHQRIDLSAGTPVSLYANGRLTATFPDPFSTVPRAHMLMLLHSNPERVFALGCLADGAIATIAKHPARELVVVEEDPELVRRLPEWYGPELQLAIADPRVRSVAAEPLRVLPDSEPWDLVVLLDGNPTTIRNNRTRSLEFFERCRRNMSEDGVLVLRVEVSDTYLGGAAGRLVSVLVSTLRQVFPTVVAVPGEEILLVAGGEEAALTVDPAELEARWASRGIEDPAFSPEMLPLLLDPLRAADLHAAIDAVSAPVNTMGRPHAVLLAAGLLEGRARPSLLRLSMALEQRPATLLAATLAIVVLGLLALAFRRRPSAGATAAVVGACSMGWWLLLIASWQATLGSVYAEVGALTAAFMGGLAAGSLAAARWAHPVGRLPWVLLGGVGLSLVAATQLPMRAPAVLVPLLLVLGGVLTGAAFPALSELAGRGGVRRGAGIAFAADEAGAAAAALVVGILALPWAGLVATATGLAILELAALPAVILALRRVNRD
jgi:spermidine synthase